MLNLFYNETLSRISSFSFSIQLKGKIKDDNKICVLCVTHQKELRIYIGTKSGQLLFLSIIKKNQELALTLVEMIVNFADKPYNDSFLPPSKVKQVTRGHNIVADGWAGASNPHSHSMPPTHTVDLV